MKLVRASATILGMLVAGDGQAQEDSQPPSLFSQTKDALSGAWKGKKIAEAAASIYSGGVQYGNALATPNRSEQQTGQGVTGGLKVVAGGATLTGTIGGTGGTAAAWMAIPIADGAGPLSSWVGNGNALARKLQLLEQGDISTLAKEETDRIKQNQAVGERFKSTTTQLIANPAHYNPKSLTQKLDSFQKDTLPKAQQRLSRETPNNIPQQTQQTQQPTSPAVKGLSATENLADNPSEPTIEASTEPQIGWRLTSFNASYSNRPPMTDECFSMPKSIEAYTKLEAQDLTSSMGCSVNNVSIINSSNSVFTYGCELNSQRATTGSFEIYMTETKIRTIRRERNILGQMEEEASYERCDLPKPDCSPAGQASWRANNNGAAAYMCPNPL